MTTQETYEKVTKETVEFPEYVRVFLNILKSKLKAHDFDHSEADVVLIPIQSKRFRYCYDAIELVEKTFKRLGYNCHMSSYAVTFNDVNGVREKAYNYNFKLSKKKK